MLLGTAKISAVLGSVLKHHHKRLVCDLGQALLCDFRPSTRYHYEGRAPHARSFPYGKQKDAYRKNTQISLRKR